MAYLGMRSLSEKKYLDTAIQALGSVLTSPDFPAEAFARELAHMKVAAESRQQSPGDIAEEAFYKAIYHDHPYASPVAGTPQSLQGLSIKDVRAFYQKYYVAKNAVIAIVGALDRAQAEALVTRISAALPAGERADDLPPVPEPDKAQEIRIDYPSQQSHIYVGQPGMKRADKDYMALYVANHPFGGSGFASRLVETVREKRGLAYSVYSYFMPMREAGPFLMALQTRSDQTEEALALLREELANYLEQGPSDAELQASINNISGSFPLNLDSNSKLLGYIAMIGFYDLPLDYLQSFVARVEAVSADEAHAAMQQRIHPDRLVTVVVGNGGAQKP
jgi:zinc protease